MFPDGHPGRAPSAQRARPFLRTSQFLRAGYDARDVQRRLHALDLYDDNAPERGLGERVDQLEEFVNQVHDLSFEAHTMAQTAQAVGQQDRRSKRPIPLMMSVISTTACVKSSHPRGMCTTDTLGYMVW